MYQNTHPHTYLSGDCLNANLLSINLEIESLVGCCVCARDRMCYLKLELPKWNNFHFFVGVVDSQHINVYTYTGTLLFSGTTFEGVFVLISKINLLWMNLPGSVK